MKSKAPGDILHTEQPFVHVIANKERGKRCDECLQITRAGELKRCSACHIARYCSITCQRKAWEFHKMECGCFQRVTPKLPMESVLLFHRLLLRHQKGETTKVQEEYLGKNRCFDDLMSHVDDIKKDARRTEDFAELCYTLKLFMGEDHPLPDAELLMQMFGRMSVNTFSVCDGEMQPIGAAIYLGASVLDHCCEPNAVAVFSGTELQIRATAPIENVDVEDVFISYTELLSSSRDRQTELEQQYYFTCMCPVCTDEDRELLLTAAKCPRESCTAPVHQDAEEKFLPCQACNFSHFPNDFHERKDTATMEAKFLLTKCKKWKREGDAAAILGACSDFLSDHGAILHAHNVYRVQVTDRLMDACIDTQRWDEAEQYAKDNVIPYREIYPKYHPSVGIHLMKYAKIMLYLKKLNEALKALQQASDVLLVTHGDDHAIIIQLHELLAQCRENMRAKRMDVVLREERDNNNDEDDDDA